MDVLQLDVSGRPQAWVTTREAAVIYASDGIAWTLGDTCHVLTCDRPGYSSDHFSVAGEQPGGHGNS